MTTAEFHASQIRPLSPAEAEATAKAICAIDDAHIVQGDLVQALWDALKARCPHPSFSSEDADDPQDPECDICFLPQSKAVR